MFTRSTSFSFGQQPASAAPGSTAAPAATTTAAGSLFGAQPQQQQPAAATGGFTFGAAQAQPQQQQQQTAPAGSGLFGGGGSLFGQPSQPQQAQPTSLFSFGQPQQPAATQPQPQPQLALSFSQPQPQQLQASTGASPFLQYPFYQRERFNDLPDGPKKMLEELDEFIQSQHRLRAEVRTKDFGVEQIKKSLVHVGELHHEIDALNELILPADLSAARELAASLDADHKDVRHMCDIVAFIHNAGNPQQSGGAPIPGRPIGAKDIADMGLGGFGVKYFANVANTIKERIERYQATMESIERFLAANDGASSQSPEAIASALKSQHNTFMDLASKVSALHADVELLRSDFTSWYQRTNNCIRDPFAGIAAPLSL